MEALNNEGSLEVCSDINDGVRQVFRNRNKTRFFKSHFLILWFQN
jgi:hypothetical protein